MAHLSLSFLGSFQVTLDGQPVTRFESAKVRALLAYLAVESDRPHSREALSGLLWPDWPQSSALANLRYALSDLRQCIADRAADPPFLVISREEIGWNPSSNYDLDVDTFGQRARDLELGSGEGDDVVERLASCAPLYRGSFLEGLSLGDSPAFEEWLRAQREHLEQRFLALLQRLGEHYERAGDYAQAQRCAERQVGLDPLREEAQRRLMRALALGGDRNGALARYQAYRALLSQELGAEPAPETMALYEQVRSGALLPPPPAPSLRIPESPHLPLSESPHPLFVAREKELARLDQWLGEALRGQGRVGFVVGEPGSGKTMLVREFAYRAMEAHPDLVAATGNCNAYAGVGDPYLPFVETLRLLSGDVEAQRATGVLSGEHARRLRELATVALPVVLQEGQVLIDVLVPGATLLESARSLPDGATWQARTQEALSHRMAAPTQAFLFDQATRVLQALARQRPLLLILDDLQWSDAASISLLFHLGRRLAGQRILIVGAYRPEEVATGREGEPHPLAPLLLEFGALWEENEVDLAQAQGRAFVEALVDSEANALGAEFREALYRHTGGHALFSVELLRGLEQRGDIVRDEDGRWTEGPALDWGRLPRRVEAVIAAHIARLPREQQELLAVASVEGEEFHAEVAARVLQRKEPEVLTDLGGPLSQEHRLLAAQSLRRVDEQRFSRYRFRHHLFQRYLYERLDPLRRAYLHGEVASALESMGAVASGAPDWTDTVDNLSDEYDDLLGLPEGLVSEAQMAWHCELAGLAQEAALHHLRAGRRSAFFSLDLATQHRHWRKALDLLSSLPQSLERAHLEQLLYSCLGTTTAHIKGQIAPEAGEAYRKSLELAERIGDPLLIADGLTVVAIHHRHLGELDPAVSLGERAVRLSRGGPRMWALFVEGHLALSHLHRGDFAASAGLLEPVSSAALDPHESDAVTETLFWFHFPWPQWCLGYPDRALQMSQAVLDVAAGRRPIARESYVAQTLAEKVCFIHQLRRETAGVEHGLHPLLAAIQENRCLPYLGPYGTLLLGWAQVQRGDLEQGIETMRRGLAEWSQQLVVMRPYWKGYLAEALGRAGRVEEGLQVLAEALEQVERTNERFNEAELWRLKGELLRHGEGGTRRLGDEEEAEACFRRAIEVARGQEARSWELRATVSLARLLQGQGRGAEGREMLAPIYGWFTEGFDTPDLVEAKALLGELTRT